MHYKLLQFYNYKIICFSFWKEGHLTSILSPRESHSCRLVGFECVLQEFTSWKRGPQCGGANIVDLKRWGPGKGWLGQQDAHSGGFTKFGWDLSALQSGLWDKSKPHPRNSLASCLVSAPDAICPVLTGSPLEVTLQEPHTLEFSLSPKVGDINKISF